jgi:hypothetical protein
MGGLTDGGRNGSRGRLMLASDIDPLGRLTMNSGPHDVARAIIGEARRRGYSPTPTIAILADAMQESGLNPRGEPKWAVAKHLPAGRQLRGPR